MPTRIVLIGAGSYVFTPSVLYDLIVAHKLSDLDLRFVDPAVDLAESMAGIARRMADEAGVRVHTTCSPERATALPGADFVITSVAVDGANRYHVDRRVAEKHGVFDLVGELGGLGGLSYTLRQVRLMLDICGDIERLCPDAILLNVSNPLPRILTAVTGYTRVRAYGFCNAAEGGTRYYDNLARLLMRPNDSLRVTSAGTNHFNWLLDIRDRATGADLYPAVRDAVDDRFGRLSHKCLREVGLLPLSGDSHIGEFLSFDAAVMTRHDQAFHGTLQEREQRRRDLMRMAAGEVPWLPLLEHRAWERPADVICALVTGRRHELPMLNLRNDGAMPELPDEAAVEMPCVVEDGRITARPVGPIPDMLCGLLLVTARINTLAARAAAEADRRLLRECIDADPAIANKAGARAAIDELIAAHADLLPNWQA